MTKKLLRKEMMDILNNLDSNYKERNENILYDKFLAYIDTHDIQSVGIVLSMPHELDTDPLIKKMLARDIKVYNPVCDYHTHTMAFYRFTSFNDIKKDSKGIRIPKAATKSAVPSLIVVPGLIFSNDGYRLGYGGGFYDRYLSSFNGVKLSLSMDEQIGTVIKEAHDVPVDIVITPSQTITI